jgi:hypothetical protein
MARLRSSTSAPPLPSSTTTRSKQIVPCDRMWNGVANSEDQNRASDPERSHTLNRGPITFRSTSIVPPAPRPSSASNDQDLSKSSSLKDPALLGLEKLFKLQLPPADYDVYEKMISDLVRRGAKELTLRNRLHPALRDFFARHPQAVDVHNKFAHSYNKRLIGKHERFHLPILEALESNGTGIKAVGADDMPQVHQRGPVTEAVSRYSSIPLEEDIAMQYDGAMDIDPSMDTDNAPLRAQVPPWSQDLGDKANQNVRPPSPHFVDVEMHGPEVAVLLGNSAQEETEVIAAMDGVDTAMRETVIAQEQEEPSRASRDAPHLMCRARDLLGTIEPSTDAGIASGYVGVVTEAAANAADVNDMMEMDNEEDRTATNDEIQKKPSVLSSFQPNGSGVGVTRQNQSSREAQSAQSYFAWLRHRQTRFPTVPPYLSEAILIARTLGKPSALFYDHIRYHWGLETDSRRGAWYKQNRLEVLGEDPRFDEEVMGTREAWLEQGRVLEASRGW